MMATPKIKIRNLSGVRFSVGRDDRGWEFCGRRTEGGVRVLAGCQDFTIAQARKHWGPRYVPSEAYPNCDCTECTNYCAAAKRRRPQIRAFIDAIEAEAIKRGWLAKIKPKTKTKAKPAKAKKRATKKRTGKKLSEGVFDTSFVISDRFGRNPVS